MTELHRNDELNAMGNAYPPRANVEEWTSTAVVLEEDGYQPGRDVVPAKKTYTDEGVNGNYEGPLFADAELKGFRDRWDRVQTSFVDEPREAVRDADSLVASVVQRIEEQFAQERSKMEQRWDSEANISTEDLRQALKRYRALFGRLLAF